MEGYDSIRLLAKAIGQAGSDGSAAIIVDALESIKYDGALGDITFPVTAPTRRTPPARPTSGGTSSRTRR